MFPGTVVITALNRNISKTLRVTGRRQQQEEEQAARNALTHESGRAEGLNTRTKQLQRQVYGRASFPLLRKRILASSNTSTVTSQICAGAAGSRRIFLLAGREGATGRATGMTAKTVRTPCGHRDPPRNAWREMSKMSVARGTLARICGTSRPGKPSRDRGACASGPAGPGQLRIWPGTRHEPVVRAGRTGRRLEAVTGYQPGICARPPGQPGSLAQPAVVFEAGAQGPGRARGMPGRGSPAMSRPGPGADRFASPHSRLLRPGRRRGGPGPGLAGPRAGAASSAAMAISGRTRRRGLGRRIACGTRGEPPGPCGKAAPRTNRPAEDGAPGPGCGRDGRPGQAVGPPPDPGSVGRLRWCRWRR